MLNALHREVQRSRSRRRVIRTQGWTLLLTCAAVGCSSDATREEPKQPVLPAALALSRVADCGEAEQLLRGQAMRRMNAQIDTLVANSYRSLDQTCPQGTTTRTAASSGSAGSAATPPIASSAPTTPAASAPASGSAAPSGSVPGSSNPPPPSGPASAPSGAAQSPMAPSDATASASSMTNNQVAEVDEADFVKNDNKYVYAVLNGALRILTAWPPEEAAELSRVQLDGAPKKLFVTGDRAFVYVSTPLTAASGNRGAGYAAHAECSYGYDCEFGGDGTATGLRVFDISDRSQPKLLRKIELRGSLVAARRIGDVVHTVVVTPELVFPGLTNTLPGVSPCDPWLTKEQIDSAAESVRIRNTRIINETPIPQLTPSVGEGYVEYADSCQSTYYDTENSGAAFSSLVSIDMVHDGEPRVTTIVSKAGAIYASDQALYMAVPRSDATDSQTLVPGQALPEYHSRLHKFQIGASLDQTGYLASGTVEGHVLNQFSMDEYDGHLRVATSSGKVPSPNVHSTLSVLEQRDGALQLEGKVENIAPGEDIRSVRFDGEHGFVVTFKKTDPLYMFDLSQPDAPRITGELKIPGFSTYMHLLDDTHLLAIGYDADDQGSFAFFSGILLQIFDVGDPSAPALLHKTVIGTRGSSSAALTNHLAFTLFQDKLAVPMTICEGGTPGSFGTNMTFSGLIVYDVSLDKGLVEHGRVAHPGTGGVYNNASCSNWWTNATSQVQRSLFMDDYVYSIAPDVMRVQSLANMGSDLASVSFVP